MKSFPAFDAAVASLTAERPKVPANKAAARRARSALMEISKLCKTLRQEIQESVNAS